MPATPSIFAQIVDQVRLMNEEQQKWMSYIKEHLKQNMTLDETDFANVPALSDRGGLKKFKKVFADDYNKIINEINLAIAA